MQARPLRFAVVGSGMIAEFHAQALATALDAELCGVFSATPERCKAFASRYGVTPYASLQALLDDPLVDAVAVATPTGAHGEVAVAAAHAKKHVLCEKPLETTPERARHIVQACAEAGVVLAPVFQFRYGAAAELMKKAVDAGRFGKVLFSSAKIKWFRPQAYYDSAPWRGTWELDGGGCLMNQSIHAIDLMIWFGGEPQEVYGYWSTQSHDIPVEDTAAAVVRFKNGAMGSIEASTSCAPGFALEVSVSGERGTATLSADTLSVWSFADQDPLDAEAAALNAVARGNSLGSGGSDPKGISIAGHVALIEDMVCAVRGQGKAGRHRVVSSREACYPIELICGFYESVRTGKPVTLG